MQLVKLKREGGRKEGRKKKVLEHDDATDKGDPKGGTKCSGEAEQVSELKEGEEIRLITVLTVGF